MFYGIGAMAFTISILKVCTIAYIYMTLFNCFSYWIQNFEANNGYVAPYDDGEESSSSGNRLKMRLKEFHRRFIKSPFFIIIFT